MNLAIGLMALALVAGAHANCDLVVGTDTSLSETLSVLNQCQSLTSLSFTGTPNLSFTTLLAGLTDITGELGFYGFTGALSTFALSFPNLKTLGSLTVNGTTNLASIDLPNLQAITNTPFRVTFNDHLLTITGSRLVQCASNTEFIIDGNAHLLSVPIISHISTSTLGSLTLQNNEKLASLSIALSAVGHLRIVGCNSLTTISNLGTTAMTTIDSVFVGSNAALQQLTGLRSVVQVGAITIVDNPSLVSIDLLTSDALDVVHGSVLVTNCPLLNYIQLLPFASIVDGNVTINKLPKMTSLSDLFGNVEKIKGSLRIEDMLTMGAIGRATGQTLTSSFSSFDYLLEVGSDVVICNNAVVNNLDELEFVEEIGLTLTLCSNALLSRTSFGGLLRQGQGLPQNHNSVGITIENNALLKEISLDGLSTIVGTLIIKNNDKLVSINGLYSLETVVGDIKIEDNDKLVSAGILFDMSGGSGSAFGFHFILSGVANIVISNNPRLCAHNIHGLDLVASGTVTIINNAAPGGVCQVGVLQELNATAALTAGSAQLVAGYMFNLTLNHNWEDDFDDDDESWGTMFTAMDELIEYGLTEGIDDDLFESTERAMHEMFKPAALQKMRSTKLGNKFGDRVEDMAFAALLNQPCGTEKFSNSTYLAQRQRKIDSATLPGLFQVDSAGGESVQIDIPDQFASEITASSCYSMQMTLIVDNPYVSSRVDQDGLVDSPVFGFGLSGVTVLGLSDSASISFTLAHSNTSITLPRVCTFWATADGGWWSTVGCTRTATNTTHTTCKCSHATNFALLVDTSGSSLSSSQATAISVLTYIGCIGSIIGAAIYLVTFGVLSTLRSGPTILTMHLCAALIGANLVFLVGVDETANQAACTAVAALLYYFLLACFAWMLCLGYSIWTLLVKVEQQTQRSMVQYVFVGWGLPLIALIIVLIVEYTTNESVQLGNPNNCWIGSRMGLVGAFLIPVACVVLINIYVLVRVVHVLRQNEQANRQRKGASANHQQLFIYVSLLVTLGATWIFAYLAIVVNHFVFWVFFVILNSSQGILLCLAYCFRQRVLDEWRKKLGLHKGKLSSSKATQSTGKTTLSDTAGKGRTTTVLMSSDAFDTTLVSSQGDPMSSAPYLDEEKTATDHETTVEGIDADECQRATTEMTSVHSLSSSANGDEQHQPEHVEE